MKQFSNQSESGFTLLELMIALVVFAVGILGVYSMQMTAIAGNSRSRMVSQAALLGADMVETFASYEYNHQALIDDDDGDNLTDNDGDTDSGDGTGKDLDNDGQDDTGGDFGLGDKTSPDGMIVNGVYTVYWNVAVDQPLPDVKTIRIIVDSQLDINDVEMTFVKYRYAN